MSLQTKSQEKTDSLKLNTKLLMVSSALFLGLLGILGSFIPQEVAGYFGTSVEAKGTLLIKLTGSLYLGFAVLNWMARGNLIGGIYSRPVALGNFFHFVLSAILLLEFLITNSILVSFAIGAGIYTIFATCFGYILFSGGKSCS
ncbi:MAG: hypothetical protein U5K69_24445 [Balneolaceae bacterium]|nr:hypothetical protein [Balneolaceae bacterium]